MVLQFASVLFPDSTLYRSLRIICCDVATAAIITDFMRKRERKNVCMSRVKGIVSRIGLENRIWKILETGYLSMEEEARSLVSKRGPLRSRK